MTRLLRPAQCAAGSASGDLSPLRPVAAPTTRPSRADLVEPQSSRQGAAELIERSVAAGVLPEGTRRRLTAHDESRTNVVHRLAVDGVPTAYAKQGGWAAHADSDDAVGCERRALSILAASGLVPQLIGPAACDVVWTRALQPCTGLTDVIRCGRTAELLLALRAWGTALAALHRWPAGIGDPPAAPKPWILEPSKAPEHLRLASSHRGAGNRVAVVLAELQRNGAVRDALATVRAGWSRTCWTHGDATTSNGVARAVDRQHWRVWLLDLESAGLGDPSWDLATAYDSLLVHRANLGRTMRPAVRALLDGYRCGDGPGRLSRELLIARAALTCVQLAASSDRQLSGRAGTAGRPAHRVPA